MGSYFLIKQQLHEWILPEQKYNLSLIIKSFVLVILQIYCTWAQRPGGPGILPLAPQRTSGRFFTTQSPSRNKGLWHFFCPNGHELRKTR